MVEALNFFKNIDQDESNEGRSSMSNTSIEEFLQLLKEKQSIGCLMDLLNILRDYKENQRPTKSVRKLSQYITTSDFDPQVNLKFDGHKIKQVVVNLGSQVNILPKETWI
jgi:hypothetical protein